MSTNSKKIKKAIEKSKILGASYPIHIPHNSLEEAIAFVQSKKYFYRKIKNESFCIRCGSSEISFHHRKKDLKIIDISEMINPRHYFTIKDISEELKKCDSMCASCHLQEEFEIHRNRKMNKI